MAAPIAPTFIVGSDRSGTTLLRLIVNEHPALAVPAETWFLIDLIDEFGRDAQLDPEAVDRAIGIVTSKRRWRNFDVSVDALRESLADRPSVGLADFFDAFMTLEIAPTGKRRWIDKTPEYVLHVEELSRLFPTARFIHISRDGRDVYQSLRKQRWRGRTALRIGKYWAACLDSALAADRTLPPMRWLWITYEDLVLDMEATTRQVCAFLEVPYDPSMLDFHLTAAEHVPAHSLERGFHTKLQRPPTSSDVYKWKHHLDWQTWLFEAVVSRQLSASGYESRLGVWGSRLLLPVAYAQHLVASAWVKVTKLVAASDSNGSSS